MNKRILVISDTHLPYDHKDTIKFLTAVKKKYRPDRVVHIGDELDYHNLSFHDSDPDLPSAGDELALAIHKLKAYWKLFPKVDVLESNHGTMPYRKAEHHGIPRRCLKDYNEFLEVPKTWRWVPELKIKVNGQLIIFRHNFTSGTLLAAQRQGACIVYGHQHSKFEIQYSSSPEKLIWGMNVGCLIENNSPAHKYNLKSDKRPIKGIGVIINGDPKLVPMVLNNKGRWIGKLL